MSPKRALKKLPEPTVARCVICGATPVQWHHIGGRQLLAWFEMPFCIPHHDRFHGLQRQVEINLSWTDDPLERIRRVQVLINIVANWIILEQFKHVLSTKGEMTCESPKRLR